MVLVLLGGVMDRNYSGKCLTKNAFTRGVPAMTHEDFITELFCRVDDQMKEVPQHSQALLWPSEVVTLGLFSRLKASVSEPFTVGSVVTIGLCFPYASS